MTDRPVSLAELALMADRSYDWAQRHWRSLPVARITAPGQPRFARASVEAWLRGEPAAQITPSTTVHPAQPAAARPANDAVPLPLSDDETRLRRAFGGR